jgi:hypothetical protein
MNRKKVVDKVIEQGQGRIDAGDVQFLVWTQGGVDAPVRTEPQGEWLCFGENRGAPKSRPPSPTPLRSTTRPTSG